MRKETNEPSGKSESKHKNGITQSIESRNSEKNKIKRNNSSTHRIVRKSKWWLFSIASYHTEQSQIRSSFTIWRRSNCLFIHTSGNVNKWNNIDIVTNNTEQRSKKKARRKNSKTSYSGGCCVLRVLCHANLVFYRAKWDTISWFCTQILLICK